MKYMQQYLPVASFLVLFTWLHLFAVTVSIKVITRLWKKYFRLQHSQVLVISLPLKVWSPTL